MSKNIWNRVIAALLFVLSATMIIVGAMGVGMRTGAESAQTLSNMRVRALLVTTGEGMAEAYITAAKKEATAKAKAAGGDMAAMREAAAKAVEEASAIDYSSLIDYDTVDTAPLAAAVLTIKEALASYGVEEAKARQEYTLNQASAQNSIPDAEPELDAIAADGESSDAMLDDMLDESNETANVDFSKFQPTEEMNRLAAVVDDRYEILAIVLKDIYPVLDSSTFEMLKQTILSLIYQHGDTYESQFDRYSVANGTDALESQTLLKARVVRYGDDMVTIGIALLILGLLVLFYTSLAKSLGLPRLIIGMFFVVLCVLSVVYDLSLPALLGNSIVRMGMNSVLVLAMVPAIQCGISLNLGLPLGIIGGLLGGLLCIEFGYSGWKGLFFAISVGIAISAVLGYLYGLLLNRLKGNEMAVTTYVGFSIVSLMCIGWLVLPFASPVLRWPLGKGLRVTLSLETSYRKILNDWNAFDLIGVRIPTGLLLFMLVCCFLVWLFLRSKTGVAMQAAGANPRFAEATGINVDKMRIIGTMLSTILGAVGIIVYSQSYGFMQLYTAPRTLGFVAASAILIGGASTSRARISHVLIGTFLFQGVLTLGMPVANVLVPQSTISETMRILISNGIILYALTKSGGASRA